MAADILSHDNKDHKYSSSAIQFATEIDENAEHHGIVSDQNDHLDAAAQCENICLNAPDLLSQWDNIKTLGEATCSTVQSWSRIEDHMWAHGTWSKLPDAFLLIAQDFEGIDKMARTAPTIDYKNVDSLIGLVTAIHSLYLLKELKASEDTTPLDSGDQAPNLEKITFTATKLSRWVQSLNTKYSSSTLHWKCIM